jgi:hypothetical protein
MLRPNVSLISLGTEEDDFRRTTQIEPSFGPSAQIVLNVKTLSFDLDT